jgi:hypothetical protein
VGISPVTRAGVWINLGPLLFHWADAHTYLSDSELSIEVSLETVERLAAHYHLRTVRREFRQCLYTTNNRSMLQVCVRVREGEPPGVGSHSPVRSPVKPHARNTCGLTAVGVSGVTGHAEYVHVRVLDHGEGHHDEGYHEGRCATGESRPCGRLAGARAGG